MPAMRKQRCPRCGGNIFIDQDIDGWFMECLQCSFRRDLDMKEQPSLKTGRSDYRGGYGHK